MIRLSSACLLGFAAAFTLMNQQQSADSPMVVRWIADNSTGEMVMAVSLNICRGTSQWFALGFSSPTSVTGPPSWAHSDVIVFRTDDSKPVAVSLRADNDSGPADRGLVEIRNATFVRSGPACRVSFRRTYDSGLWPIYFDATRDPSVFFVYGELPRRSVPLLPIEYPSTAPHGRKVSGAVGPTKPDAVDWAALPVSTDWIGVVAVGVSGVATVAAYAFLISGAVAVKLTGSRH